MSGTTIWPLGRLGRAARSLERADRARREESAVWTLDRVIRTFAETCGPALTGARGFVRCRIGLHTVRIDLTSPTATAPEPWTASEGGRVLTARMSDLQSIPLTGAGSAGLGAVVAIGSEPEGTVLVDLAAVGGIVSIDGDRSAARAVVARIVDQIATDPWSVGFPVLVVGMRSARFGAGRSVTFADAIDAARSTGGGGLIVLGGSLHEENARALAEVLERPGGRWAAVAIGATAVSRWRLDARSDGTVSSPELGTVRWSDVALSGGAPRPASGPAAPSTTDAA